MRHDRQLHRKGFTVVELVVVIVVIGILAAITVVGYDGMQNKAHDSAVQSDFTNVIKELAIERASGAPYPLALELKDVGLSFTEASYDRRVENLIYFIGKDGNDQSAYVLVGQGKTGIKLSVSSKYGKVRPYNGPWYKSSDFNMMNYLMTEFGMSTGDMSLLLRP